MTTLHSAVIPTLKINTNNGSSLVIATENGVAEYHRKNM